MARKRAENREGSLGFPGFVKPVFTKDSETPREKQKIIRACIPKEPYYPQPIDRSTSGPPPTPANSTKGTQQEPQTPQIRVAAHGKHAGQTQKPVFIS
ncbi:hypothetical protein TNCV_1174181 [Trichonephila clavipes]|nr:hypothetical protein TNCV_1174181 [Trichonephila clavipes]